MRSIPIKNLVQGMTLASPLYSERGQLLLTARTSLTQHSVTRLRRMATRDRPIDVTESEIGIRDDAELLVPHAIRKSLRDDLGQFVDSIAQATEHLIEVPTPILRQELAFNNFTATFAMDALNRVRAQITKVVARVLDASVARVLGEIRAWDTALFTHSINSTVLALVLGRRLHLDPPELERIALGCLLHDIGMIAVGRDIIDKPGPLTPDERERLELHPMAGYEILRRMQPSEVLVNHVAYQHHERQDGTGYPRGLRGSNRIHRGIADRRPDQKLLLQAEIVAVADVFAALLCPRPYRPAFHPEHAVTILRSMAGHHLNRHLVEKMIAVVPFFYPVQSDPSSSYRRSTRENGDERDWRSGLI